MPTAFDLFAENVTHYAMAGSTGPGGLSARDLAVEALEGLAGGDSRVLEVGEKCLAAARAGDSSEVEKVLDLMESSAGV